MQLCLHLIEHSPQASCNHSNTKQCSVHLQLWQHWTGPDAAHFLHQGTGKPLAVITITAHSISKQFLRLEYLYIGTHAPTTGYTTLPAKWNFPLFEKK